jgi:hypothetical protein
MSYNNSHTVIVVAGLPEEARARLIRQTLGHLAAVRLTVWREASLE